ncbi:lipopolysaccharide kinase InaA family protein [Sulfuriflexus mobilis]|uniref:lipopolysaccharide kinase InaA family protein n=1 Tax=Sulfuriflexus mobilis TaxID=1811807 RepID=UPI000F8211D3|nr:lipopolysaccharide kinase InaA family protein [Sulfuriflexus mobilis]
MQEASQLWDSGYTPILPLGIDLPDGSHITCDEVVRAMPGRRYVCRGKWGERDVFIKLFMQEARATREWQNEQRGIGKLEEKAIAAPKLLLSTSLTQPAAHVLVYAALEQVQSSRERWESEDDEGRHQLLEELVDLLATHHAAGLRQQDLHMRNFLYSGSILYTLDAADIEINPGELNKQASVENLAALFALLRPEYDQWLAEFYARYCQHRGWQVDPHDEAKLLVEVRRQRRYKQNKFLDKVFRHCTAFVANKTWRRFHVYDRHEDKALFRELVSNPDILPVTAHRSILKAGNTCTVTSVRIGQQQLVCKRYNIKNIWHGLGRAFRPSRASRSWRSAHRLLMHGIATAKPLALIENRFGPLRGTAWFIMQAVEGPSAHEFFREPSVSQAEQFSIASQFAEMLIIMRREQISHGDMKATNFMISDGRLVVLDLDALRQHRNKSCFEYAFRRDLRRFFQNWGDLPEVAEQFREVFSAAGLQADLPAE